MKRIIVWLFIFSFESLIFFQSFVLGNPQDLLSRATPIEISFVECTSSAPTHSVEAWRVDEQRWKIRWKWNIGRLSICSWRTEITPEIDLSKYPHGYFEIEFIGAYKGSPPHVKLISSNERHSRSISFSMYLEGNQYLRQTVRIPIRVFTWRPALPRDSVNIEAIQFETDMNSSFGKITITGIRFSKFPDTEKDS